jgi:DNA-binding transcriptional ArsR family regulator
MSGTTAKRSARSKAQLFHGLSEPSRLLILETLREAPRTVTEICRITGLSQSNVSNHLACLLGCRLVERESRGRFAFYRLAHSWVEGLLSLADEVTSSEASDSCCPICGSDIVT